MSRIYQTTFRVPPESVDQLKHINNLEYLRWMQDAAVAHSAACGWPMERYFENGTAWVVRTHSIEYIAPGFDGEELTLVTWVPSMAKRSSPRRYALLRVVDGQILAKAETLWVYVNMETGKPIPIPEELSSCFSLVSDEEALGALPLVATG